MIKKKKNHRYISLKNEKMMHLSEPEKLFLALLASFVRGSRIDTKVKLTEKEWEVLYSLSVTHHVCPMIFEAVSLAGMAQEMPEYLFSTWKKNTRMNVVRQMQITSFFLPLYEEMRKEGIDALVVKGLVCRSLYEKPDYRLSTDEDLLVHKEDFWKVDRFLCDRGFSREESSKELVKKMDILHEVGYLNRQTGLYLEIHLSLFEEMSGACGHFNRMFDEVWEHTEELALNGSRIRSLSHTDHFLYLLCHDAKHFMYSGFGIRQLFDLVLYAEKYGGQICWPDVVKKAQKMNLYGFLMHLLWIGRRYLGFDRKKAHFPFELPKNTDAGALLSDILAAGVYGKTSEARLHSANITLAAADGKKNGGLLRSIFPGMEYMKKSYGYLKHFPYLLPVAWMHRLISYLLRTGRAENRQMFDIGNRRVELLRKYGMTE